MPGLAKYFIESENIGLYEQILENVTIIDAHTHVGVDVDGSSLSAVALLKSMKQNDINKSIIFPQNDPRAGKTFSQPNEAIYRAYTNNPDKFIPFFRLNPKFDWTNEFEKRVSQKFVGLKLHPSAQNFLITSPKAMKLYEKVQDAGLIMLIHSGFGLSSVAEDLNKIAKTFPKLKILVGHGAFPDLQNAIRLLPKNDNVYFEASTMRIFDLLELLKSVHYSKIVFGSDIPYYDQTLSLQVLIDSATLARKQPHQIRKMLGENMEKWLK